MTDDTALPQATPAKPAPADPRPWPRYFARTIDALLFGTIVMFVFVIVLALTTETGADRVIALSEGIGGLLLSNVLVFVLAMLPIACLLAFAQTPGKWLFGIRVRNLDGSRLGLAKALKREAWVLVRGIGLAIPVVTLFTHIASFSSLKDDGITAWDQALGCDVQHAPATKLWWLRATLGGALVLAFSVWGYIDTVMAIGRL